MLPLEGITVVAVEQAVAAPFATRQLADLGARIIKVERPSVGDFARGYDATVRRHVEPFRLAQSLEAVAHARFEARPRRLTSFGGCSRARMSSFTTLLPARWRALASPRPTSGATTRA